MDAAKVNKVQGDNPPPSEASTSNTRLFPRGTRATTEATEDETEILSFNTLEESADRAIGGVRRKLDKSLSVEYTVNELITTARDPANLAMIFAGRCLHCFFLCVVDVNWLFNCRMESFLLVYLISNIFLGFFVLSGFYVSSRIFYNELKLKLKPIDSRNLTSQSILSISSNLLPN